MRNVRASLSVNPARGGGAIVARRLLAVGVLTGCAVETAKIGGSAGTIPSTDTGDAAGADASSEGEVGGTEGTTAASDPGGSASTSDGADDTSVPGTSTTFEVLTLNLLHGYPDFEAIEARTAAVVAFLQFERPDAIAVQEAHVVGGLFGAEPRLDEIADATGYYPAWYPINGVEGVFQEGPGLLTREEPQNEQTRMLPHVLDGGRDRRGAVGVAVDTELGRVQLVSVHTTNQDVAGANLDQVAEASAFAQATAGRAPAFLMGDFNSEPDAQPMEFLRGERAHMGETAQWRDAWLETRGSEPGLTWPSDAPEKRIDYIYVVDGRDVRVEANDCELVLADPVGGTLASDHLGVLCEFTLSR